ncbi:MAG: EAL domain-containing protein [Sulfurimonas sp.]|nr:EAL domain-containing protein [Sulfurimonas sp.]
MLDVSLMLVEDDVELRSMLERILSREIKTVKSYELACEALIALESSKPDMIITDIKMPTMNGLEMIAVIRRLYGDIPIIVLSAFSESEYFIKSIDLKVNHFLTKPVDIEKLLETIQTVSSELLKTQELEEQKILLKQYKHIVDLSTNITITDKKGKITYTNDAFCELSGYTKEELIGSSHNIVRHPDVKKSFYQHLWSKILDKQVWQGVIKNRRKDGTDFYVETTIAPLLDSHNNIIEFISIKSDITAIILAKNELQTQIVTDRLTQLPNRIKLQEDIRSQKNATLIVFDINHFKEINLLFGVSLGDEALIYFSKIICERTSSIQDIKVYRISADEFAILKSGDAREELEVFAHDLHNFIGKYPFKYQEISFGINFTSAIAYKMQQEFHLLETALDALDYAKKNKHFLYTFDELASRQKEYEKNFEWTKKIKEALQEKRVKAYFQPIYDSSEKKITKYESLVRIVERDGSVVSPFVFLEIAKHSNLYSEITKTMILQACETFAVRKEVVTINFSIEDLLEDETITYFIEKVKQYGMQNRVVAEVLESEGIDNFDIFKKVIVRLKENGIRSAIDDFGSGYSNFSYLISLDIDILKIDGSLIRFITKDANSKIIVSSIVSFAHQLGMQTVAEFVADKDIFDEVEKLGIDLIQGYYISEPLASPLPEDTVLAL